MCTQAEPTADGTAKIPPLPESFVRYDNPWRDGVRQFQVDLENGRYDPEWIRQAEVAVRERAEGLFDDFKEREFEQFWGQKQKMDRSLAAGESSQVKLKMLVEHGVIRVGDVWKLSRGFNVPGGRVLVEKEAKACPSSDICHLVSVLTMLQILELKDTLMTCVVPAGQRAILPHVPEAEFKALLKAYKSTTGKETDSELKANGAKKEDHEQAVYEIEEEGTETRELRKRKSEIENGPRKKQQQEVPEQETSDLEAVIPAPTKQENPQKEMAQHASVEITDTKAGNDKNASSSPETTAKPENGIELDTDTGTLSLAGAEVVILPNVNGATSLGNRMIEVDGRIKQIPNGNAWKEFRCYRNNQDMGSLWEVRQAWYVKQK